MDDLDSVKAWQGFLTQYAVGAIGSETTPLMPPLPPGFLQSYTPDSPSKPWTAVDVPLYSSAGHISLEDARTIRDYYCKYHYLPPPRTPLEGERQPCINAYNLYAPKQVSNIQAATDLVAAFFPDTICTFSLMENHSHNCYCISGDEDMIRKNRIEVGKRVFSEDSLCSHAALYEGAVFHAKDLQHDWRYRRVPFASSGFKGFIGSTVSLKLDPVKDTDGQTVVVGTLNICFVKGPIADFTQTQRSVVRHITAMLETQLRATWEGDQRTKEGQARMLLSELIDVSLVEIDMDDDRGREVVQRVGRSAVDRLYNVFPEVDGIALFNTGGVPDHTGAYIPDVGDSCEVIANAGRQIRIPQQVILNCANAGPATKVFYANNEEMSGLESHLPPGVRSHLVLPLQTANKSYYLLIACSSESRYSFPTTDVNIFRSVGSILRAKAVQLRVMLADAAKTSFLSSISHELRTPMHGVKASLELIRKLADAEEWDQIQAPLGLAESSGRALLNILNDVLDFGRPTWDKGDEEVTDLAKSAEEIASMCLAHYGDVMGEKGMIRLEYEDRDWHVNINAARYQRIIANGLTNAIKFCPDGDILVSLRTTSDQKSVIIEVHDDGIGIAEDALPRLMQPFTKMDSHSPGAGLGLYITKSLVANMGGELTLRSTLHQGTTFSATLPVALDDRSIPSFIMLRRELYGYTSNEEMSKHTTPSTSVPHQTGSGPSRSRLTNRRRGLLSSSNPAMGPPAADINPIKILIIDDNSICRKILRMAFKHTAVLIEVEEAEDGRKGVDVFASFQPDIVFTDVSMPVMDGVAAARRMRELFEQQTSRRGSCRIYALTGLGSSDPRMQSIGINGKAALDGWLTKGKDMLDAVDRILVEVEAERTAEGNA